MPKFILLDGNRIPSQLSEDEAIQELVYSRTQNPTEKDFRKAKKDLNDSLTENESFVGFKPITFDLGCNNPGEEHRLLIVMEIL